MQSPSSSKILLLGLTLVSVACGVTPQEDAPGYSSAAITDGVVHAGHPSVGFLDIQDSSGQGYFCTGTLIGQRTVLTAAHCLKDMMSATFTVGGGSYPAAQLIVNPKYTSSPTLNDIAIVRLSQHPSVTPTPISTRAPWVGLPLVLVGFGITADGLDDSGTKRMAKNSVADVTPVRFNMRGTGGSQGNICSGDSGGPAFAFIDGREVQVGVHSYGEGLCGVSEWDARVDPFVPWIQKVSGGDVVLSGAQDVTPPRLSFMGLQDGQALKAGAQVIQLNASDDVAVTRVELVVDSTPMGQKTQAPFRFDVDLDPGTHTLNARAHDASGKTTTAAITVQVVDGTPAPRAPRVEILWPGAGSRIPTQTTVQVGIHGAISSVVLAIDGTVIDLKRVGPFTFPIAMTPGEHDILVVAEDLQGQEIGRASIHVEAAAKQEEVAPPPTLGEDMSYELRGGCNLGRRGGGQGNGAALFFGLPLVLFALRRSRRP